MNARKFIAASSRDALKLVRVELGVDAVILSNRKVADGVEIVAVAGSELAHLSETRVNGGKAVETKKAKPNTGSGKLSAQGAHQAATLGAKVLEANHTREKTASPATQDTSAEQQTLLSEIKSMRNIIQEQLACMAWSDLQLRDPKRSGLLRQSCRGRSPTCVAGRCHRGSVCTR